MADLHDALKAGHYTGHELRVFLVRILFCLFAEDTGIFGQPRQFELYLINHTAADGSDLGPKLARLFRRPQHARGPAANAPEADSGRVPLRQRRFVQGDLAFADFNSDMRNALLAASRFRWEKISPAVFGSLFQEVMQAPERRQLRRALHGREEHHEGRPLPLSRRPVGGTCRHQDRQVHPPRSARLDEFHDKLAGLRFLDPGLRLWQFSRHHLPRDSRAGVGSAQTASTASSSTSRSTR